jgi:uncharacterized protein (DUF952 family)
VRTSPTRPYLEESRAPRRQPPHLQGLRRVAWEEAASIGAYRGSAVDLRDGFIHFSTSTQLADTLRRHFVDQRGLVLVAVDPDDLGARLRWEPSRSGDLFPHLYGELPVVIDVE